MRIIARPFADDLDFEDLASEWPTDSPEGVAVLLLAMGLWAWLMITRRR
jgi:hypothetical protein